MVNITETTTIRVLFALKIIIYRQPPEMFYKKSVLKYFAIFSGKQLGCFPVHIANYFEKHLRAAAGDKSFTLVITLF